MSFLSFRISAVERCKRYPFPFAFYLKTIQMSKIKIIGIKNSRSFVESRSLGFLLSTSFARLSINHHYHTVTGSWARAELTFAFGNDRAHNEETWCNESLLLVGTFHHLQQLWCVLAMENMGEWSAGAPSGVHPAPEDKGRHCLLWFFFCTVRGFMVQNGCVNCQLTYFRINKLER